MSKKNNIAIVGATGLVGKTMLKIIEERNFPFNEIKLFASKKSVGTQIPFKNNFLTVEELYENPFENIEIALFSAGSFVSEKFAPIAKKSGCTVIDNSSFWRMKSEVPLVVPEVNSEKLQTHNGIIANPNCSTIQLVVPLHFISQKYKIKRLNISTYQAISGAGQEMLEQYYSEMKKTVSACQNNPVIASDSVAISFNLPEIATPLARNDSKICTTRNDANKILNNIMFHSDFNENGNTVEEEKMINETRKILDFPLLPISVTCVRIPVENSHCMSVNIEFEDFCNLEEIKNILSNSAGIIFVDEKTSNKCNSPTPLLCNGRDEVFVGRLRKEIGSENIISMWICADNLRKGAATNAVQIAENLLKNV